MGDGGASSRPSFYIHLLADAAVPCCSQHRSFSLIFNGWIPLRSFATCICTRRYVHNICMYIPLDGVIKTGIRRNSLCVLTSPSPNGEITLDIGSLGGAPSFPSWVIVESFRRSRTNPATHLSASLETDRAAGLSLLCDNYRRS